MQNAAARPLPRAPLTHADGDGPTDEERFALVSVLQELTVAALELFDPRSSADTFLERLAERFGCLATVIIAGGSDGRPVLQAASGLSPRSRALPLAADLNAAPAGDEPLDLPYPELHGRDLVTWRLPLPTPAGATLVLFFTGEPRLPARYRGMLRRLAEILSRVLEHRSLFARSIESERRLDEKSTIIECLSDASPDGVLGLDHDGEVFFFNRRFVQMWGLEAVIASRSRDRIARAAAAQMDEPDADVLCLNGLAECLESNGYDELRLMDGRTFERQIRLVRSAEGTTYGHALFFRDISGRKAAEAEREKLLETERAAHAAAEEAIRARDEFLSVASHELRTPLTSLLLATQQVLHAARDRRTVVSAMTLRALETTRRQADRLVRLVDALLDVTRIQAGRLQLAYEDTDLAELVREVVARLQQDIERTNGEVVVHVEGPVLGSWDRSRIDQVVTNLVSNAIKYGRGEPVDITIGGTDEAVCIEVRDRGIGISPENAHRLFQKFERAVSARQFGGLGLGLFIVRQLVELHGGTVGVTSEPNVGSTFTVSLPRRPPASTGEQGEQGVP